MAAGAAAPDQDRGAAPPPARSAPEPEDLVPATRQTIRVVEDTQRIPDAVILDLGLPDLDGIDLIRELRLITSAPVIVLSGRTGPGDKIGALDAGADDYVTKPFSMEELLARLRAALRRDGPAQPERPVTFGSCTVDSVIYQCLQRKRAA